jgi:hypothetical protein
MIMEEEKIYKPKRCEYCPVVIQKKGFLICGVEKKLKADIRFESEKAAMWKSCKIGWDKP